MMINDTQDWQVVDRIGEYSPIEDLQYGEAVELAHEKSANFGPLLKEGEPTERYIAQINVNKVRFRYRPYYWCDHCQEMTYNFEWTTDGDLHCLDCGKVS